MSYALSPSEALIWRQKPYFVNSFVYFSNPAIVLDASINQATFNYPVSQITYDNVTAGSHANAAIGFTVCIRSSTGVIKGFARVSSLPTASVINIGRVSQGEIDFADNDRITIYRDLRIFSRIPYINPNTGEQFKDSNLSYSNQNTNIPPKANAGVWIAGKPNNGNNLRVDLHGGSSFAVAEGATISSRLWNIQDGTLITGALTDSDITVDFPAGERWVSLTVTDSNGTTHTAYTLVVNDPTPINTEITRLNGSIEAGGWEMEVNVYEDNIDILPGTPVIHWVEEYFGSDSGGLTGYNGRENIRFTGWVKEIKQEIGPFKDYYKVICVGAAQRLQDIPAFSNTLIRTASPTAWHEVPSLTHWKAIYHQIYWHTTAHLMCDIVRPTYYANYPVGILDIDPSTAFNQLKQLASNVGAKFTVNKHGILAFHSFNPITTAGEKAAKVVVVDLDSNDWLGDLNIEIDNTLKYSWIFGQGLLASASEIPTPFLCKAPGSSPSQGGATETVGRQLVTSQAELNERIGNYYADKNSKYSPITLKIANGGCIVDPCDLQWVTISLDATTNKAGLEFVEQRGWVDSVSVSYNNKNANAQETWVFKIEVDGVDATTELIPSEDTETTIDYNPIIEDEYTTPDIYEPNELDSEITESLYGVAFSFSNPAGITFNRDDPDWQMFHNPTDEEYVSLIVDEYSSYFSHADDVLNLYGLTNNPTANEVNLYYIEDALSETPTFNQYTISSVEGVGLLRPVRGVNGGVSVYINSADSGGSTVGVTFDGGDLSYTVNQGTVSSGGRSGNGLHNITDTGNIVANIRIDLGQSTTLVNSSFWINVSFNNTPHEIAVNITGYQSNGTTQTGTTTNQQRSVTNNTWTQLTNTGLNWSNTRYVEINMQNPSFQVASFVADDFSFDTTMIDLSAAIIYSSNFGATQTDVFFGEPIDEFSFDVDDYNLGITIAVAGEGTGSRLFFTNDNYAETPQLITDIANSGNGIYYNLIRIPYKRISSITQRNNNSSALEFVYGATDLISGESLWRVTFDADTNTVDSTTDITPVIASESYAIALGFGEQLEINGKNPRIMLGCFRNDTDNTIHVLRTVDGGTTWVDCGELDVNYIKWSNVGTLSAWFAGNDGIFYTGDRGDTFTDKTTDYVTDIGALPVGGAFSINR